MQIYKINQVDNQITSYIILQNDSHINTCLMKRSGFGWSSCLSRDTENDNLMIESIDVEWVQQHKFLLKKVEKMEKNNSIKTETKDFLYKHIYCNGF